MSAPARTDQVEPSPVPGVDDRDAVVVATAMAAVETFSDIHYSEQPWFDAASRRAVAALDAARLARRTRSIADGEVRIPTAIEDESGDRCYVFDHVTPEAMVLAVVLEQATCVGNTEAIGLLVGTDDDTDKVLNANTMLTRVSHRWAIPIDDERFEFVEAGTPDAYAVTVLAL